MKTALTLSVGILATLGAWLYAQPSKKGDDWSAQIGRFQVIQVTYYTSYSGDSAADVKVTTSMKIDTATGKAWLLRSDIWRQDKPFLIVGSLGWEEVPDQAPDLLKEVSRQNKEWKEKEE